MAGAVTTLLSVESDCGAIHTRRIVCLGLTEQCSCEGFCDTAPLEDEVQKNKDRISKMK